MSQVNARRSPTTTAGEPFPLEFYRDKIFQNLVCEAGAVSEREFVRCRFIKCSFERTHFKECSLEDCSFEQCNLGLIKQKMVGFLGVKFEDSKIIGVDWTHPKNPFDVSFLRCNLDNSIFAGMKLGSTRMSGCSIRDADFTNADLTKCAFDSSDLAGSRFENCNLSFADFSQAMNYSINPTLNKLKKTKFALPEAASLLRVFDIVLK
jgi:uncharacterized protein YjbI with pentapeptide repeats